MGRRAAAGALFDARRARALASRSRRSLARVRVSRVGGRGTAGLPAGRREHFRVGSGRGVHAAHGPRAGRPFPDPRPSIRLAPSACRPLRDASRRSRASARVSPHCFGAASARSAGAQPNDALQEGREVARRAVRGMDAAPGAHREVFTASRQATCRARRRPEQGTHPQLRQRQRGEHQRRGNRDRIARPGALA